MDIYFQESPITLYVSQYAIHLIEEFERLSDEKYKQ